MASANTSLVLKCAATATPTVDFDGIKKATITLDRQEHDVTDFADSTFRKRILGLKDFPISLSGDAEFSDTSFALMRTSYGSGATVYVRILPDGTNGFEVGCLVKSMSFDNDVDSVSSVSIDLVSTTDVTIV